MILVDSPNTKLIAGLGLYLFSGIVDIILTDLILGKPIKINIFAFITMPIFLAYYMTKYESKCLQKVTDSEKQIKDIIDTYQNKIKEINFALEKLTQEVNEEIQEQENILYDNNQSNENKLISIEVLKKIYKKIKSINALKADLNKINDEKLLEFSDYWRK